MKFAVDFEGWITVEAETPEEAQEIFWNWVGDIPEKPRYYSHTVILKTPFFECVGVEEE